MCLYNAPLLLDMPDLSAAAICALPLAMSAMRWSELLTAWVGLAVAFITAHLFIIALQHSAPPSTFYWGDNLLPATASSLAVLAYAMTLFYSTSSSVQSLARAEFRSAGQYFLMSLALLAAPVSLIAHIIQASANVPQASTLISNRETVPDVQDITPVDCMFPPFGEDYTWLAALIIAELLVAAGITNTLNRALAPKPKPSKVSQTSKLRDRNISMTARSIDRDQNN